MGDNLNHPDTGNYYTLFRREVLEKITVEEDHFEFEPEINAKIAKLEFRI